MDSVNVIQATIRQYGTPVDTIVQELRKTPKLYRVAMRSALSRVRSSMGTEAKRAAREKYAIAYKLLSDHEYNENPKLRMTGSGVNIQAEVAFRGKKFPMYKYDGTRPKTDTRQARYTYVFNPKKGRKVRVPIGWQVSARQFKTSPVKPLKDGFIVRASNAKTGGSSVSIWYRAKSGKQTSFPGTGWPYFHKMMGNAAPQMYKNPEVSSRIILKARKTFESRMEHEVKRILNGWGGLDYHGAE